MSDPARRGLRTLLQVSLVSAVVALLAGFELIHWTTIQTALVMAVATPVIGFLQNYLEDNPVIAGRALPALLKAPASSGLDPTPEHPLDAAMAKTATPD